jgi:hypothetical protein
MGGKNLHGSLARQEMRDGYAALQRAVQIRLIRLRTLIDGKRSFEEVRRTNIELISLLAALRKPCTGSGQFTNEDGRFYNLLPSASGAVILQDVETSVRLHMSERDFQARLH